MKGELEQDCFDTLTERMKEKCPNLSDEAINLLASGMIQRIVRNRLSTEKEKKNILFEMMKGD